MSMHSVAAISLEWKRNLPSFLRMPTANFNKKGPAKTTVIMGKLRRLLMSWHRSENGNEVPPAEEQPLRSELFNVEQLERHAKK